MVDRETRLETWKKKYPLCLLQHSSEASLREKEKNKEKKKKKNKEMERKREINDL